MLRSDKKRAILMTAILLSSTCGWFGPVAGSSGASYSIYVKTSDGWALQEELHLSKYYETASIDLSTVLPDVDGEYKVRIAQQGGIAAHIDYVALSDGTPLSPTSATCIDDGRDILRKVVSLDNDVAVAWSRTIECAWDDGSSAPVLLFNANQELYTIEAPLLTPFVMTPELMMPYNIQNNGIFVGDSVPDTGEADFSDYWTPTTGHPWGYTYLWLRSDGEYMYAIMEITSDNTYDETGWGSLYVYANGALQEFRVDTTSREYGVDRFVYTGTVPWQHIVYEFKIPLAEIEASVGDSIKIGYGSYGTEALPSAEKFVQDPETGQWVKELTASVGDILRFKCTFNNTFDVNLTTIRFWDILDCSLEFAGSATLTNASGIEQAVTLPCALENCFEPIVLHPDTYGWNLSQPTNANFSELCPEDGTHRQIIEWEDNYPWDIVSAGDQIKLSSATPYYWYHVDRVPYTLNLSNANGTKYFDSVLNWDEVDLTNPLSTEWLAVCDCKDRYTLIAWQDIANIFAHLSGGDLVILRNERTLEEVQYRVEEVAKDLVVSREYEMDYINGWYEPLILEPGQTITIEYDATVVRSGVDNNIFGAKGKYVGGYAWVHSNQDKVTITVPGPSAAKAPVITPFGIAALIGLLSVIAIGTIARMRKKS
jgi:uncharacterized repeat protein (TIGR01451 family)